MQIGNIHCPATYEPLSRNPTWAKVFEWIHAGLKGGFETGDHQISGPDLRVIVKMLKPTPRGEHDSFESHREEVDLHFCVGGSQIIEWMPEAMLRVAHEYDPAKDVTLYSVPGSGVGIRLTPGDFAIFHPKDGHMPGIKAEHEVCQVLIFKINRRLIP